MFCIACGASNRDDAPHCRKCYATLATGFMDTRPLHSASRQGDGAWVPLWNPNAAVNWSLLLTPAFGAYLHMLNWRALGENRQAAISKGWFIAGLLVPLLQYLLANPANPQAAKLASGSLYLAFLLAWYFTHRKLQARHLNTVLRNAYVRRGWGMPLLIGLVALLAHTYVARRITAMLGQALLL